MKLRLGFLYPNLLNLYGDRGNVECLLYRCRARKIEVQVEEILLDQPLPKLDLLFSGGGPDLCQKIVAEDLAKVKGEALERFIQEGKVALFICGSYQLLGHYYRPAEGPDLPGVGALDLTTQHFGLAKKRCLGNVQACLNRNLLEGVRFFYGASCPATVVGFENHGGRTYLGPTMEPLAQVKQGWGNNGEDKTEGVFYQNILGTYLHGPLLPKNPHLADWLIGQALAVKYGEREPLTHLPDDLAWQAHRKAWRLKP